MSRAVYSVFVVLILVFLWNLNVKSVTADDFPSLLTANASIAIILDREYLDTQYDGVLAEIKVIIERVLREDLKNGGLIVSYYSWTRINLKKDFTAVLSIANCEDTWNIFRDAQKESLLLMAMTEPDCPRLPFDEAIMIPMMTPGEELPQVILDAKAQHSVAWKSAVLLYDTTFDRDMISRCVIALSRDFPDESGLVKPLSVTIYRIKETAHEWDRRKYIRELLKTLPVQFIGKNFMVLVTTKLMQTIMEVARDLRMVDTFAQWLYVVSDTNYQVNNISSILPLVDEGTNIAFIYNFTRSGDDCSGGVKCHANELLRSFVLGLSKAIKEEGAIYGQISDEEWEIIRSTKKERRDSVLEYMNDMLTKTSKCSNCTTWRVETVENWGKRYDEAIAFTDDETSAVAQRKIEQDASATKLLIVGSWNPLNGLRMDDVLFPHISHGFRQKNFHIITYHNPPWQILAYNESGIAGTTSRGVIIDILNEMSKKLNFTYTLHVTAGTIVNQNYTEDVNSSAFAREIHLLTTDIPIEVLSLLADDKVILAAVASTVNDRYKRMINFTSPISIQPYSFMVAKPREISRIYLFTAPFTNLTWFCLAIMLVIVPPILFAVNRLSPFYDFHGKPKKLGLGKIDNCFWYVYGALLQQGGMYLPSADSGRILIGAWWLIVIVLTTTYCGNLVAFLTFPKIDIQIKTVANLVASGTVTWGMRSGTYLEDYIKETDSEKYQQLYRGAKFYQDENDDVIDLVRKGSHVYIDWRSNLQYIMKREYIKNERCDFALSVEEFMEEQIAMILPMGSPYLELFNLEVKRLHQMGFIERWLKEYSPKRDRCWKTASVIEVINHTVNIDDMQGSFIVLLIGFGGGFILFLLECIWRRHRFRSEKEIIKPFVE